MSLPTKPTGPIKWANQLLNNGPASGPNRIDAPTLYQDEGWAWNAKPPADILNGWGYNVYKMLDWCAQGVEDHETAIEALGSTFGVDENNMSTVAYPSGGTFSATGNVSGALKILLPNSWTDTRLKFYVDIFEEDTGETTSILVSGFNTISSGWTDNQASLASGSRKKRVRLGHDGAKCCVIVGSTSDTWVSPHVRIRSFTGHGGSSWQYLNWVSGWGLSFIVSEAGLAFTGGEVSTSAFGSITDFLITSSHVVDITNVEKRIIATSATAGNLTVTLASSLTTSGKVLIRNESNYILTISMSTGTIEGRSSIELRKGQQIELEFNSTSTMKVITGTFYEENTVLQACVISNNFSYVDSSSATVAHTWDSQGGESSVNTCATLFTDLDTFVVGAKRMEIEILFQHLDGGFDNEPSTFLRVFVDWEKGKIQGDFSHCGGSSSAMMGYFDSAISAGSSNYSATLLHNSAGFTSPIVGLNGTTKKINKLPILGYASGTTMQSVKIVKHF